MAKISLNIYDPHDKRKIAKKLEVDGYDLMLGTIEDFVSIIDLNKIDDSIEIAKMAAKSYKQLKPLVMDIFPEVTDEDYRNIKAAELGTLIMAIGASILEDFNEFKNSKNLKRE